MPLAQVIFYWTLLARHFSRAFDANPRLRPPPPPGDFEASRQIALNSIQDRDRPVIAP